MYKKRIMWKWYITKAKFWHIISSSISELIKIADKCKLFKIANYLCKRYSDVGRMFLGALTQANYYAKLLHEAAFK